MRSVTISESWCDVLTFRQVTIIKLPSNFTYTVTKPGTVHRDTRFHMLNCLSSVSNMYMLDIRLADVHIHNSSQPMTAANKDGRHMP